MDVKDRTRTVIRNAGAMALSNVVLTIVSILVVPVTLSGLGVARYGVMQAILSFGGLVATGDFGLGLAVRTRVAHLTGAGDDNAAREIIGEALIALSIVAIVFLAAVAIVLHFVEVGALLHLAPELRAEATAAVVVAAIAFAAKMPLSVFASAQSGLQIGDRLVGWSVGGNTLGSLAAAILAYRTHRVDACLGARVGVVVVASFIAAFVGCRVAPSSVPKLKIPSLAESYSLVKTGAAYFMMTMEVQIIGGIDSIVIARFIGPEAVTYYVLSHRVITIGDQVVASLAGSFWNGVANALGAGQITWVEAEARRLRRLGVLAMTVFASGYVMIASPVVSLWTQGRIEISPWLPLAFGGYFLLVGHTRIDQAILAGGGRLRALVIIMGAEALLNLGASIALARPLGYVGVGLGTLLAYALCDFAPVQITSGRFLYDLGVRDPRYASLRSKVWSRELSAGVVSTLASFCVWYFVGSQLQLPKLGLMFLMGTASMAISCSVIYLVAGRESFMLLWTVASRVGGRIGRRVRP